MVSKMQTCLMCNEELLFNDRFMLAVDRPYLNLWIHKECFKTHTYKDFIKKISEYIVKNDIKCENVV